MGNNKIKKVAIVVGHTEWSKGAQSPYLPAEYDYNLEVANKLKQYGSNYDVFTVKSQRKPTYFSRWMNLVNIFTNIFGGLK